MWTWSVNQPEINSFFFTINVDKRCVIDTQPRAGKSYFEEKKIELDYVTGATDNLWKRLLKVWTHFSEHFPCGPLLAG